MAEEINKYQNSFIYTIKTKTGLYVGSSYDFKRRLIAHKSCIYNEKSKKYNLNLYKNIRENDGEFNMEIYKMFPCNNREELRIEETKIMQELNSNLNIYKGFNTKEQIWKDWYEKNKDERVIYCKEWRENNKEWKKNYVKKKSASIQCECGSMTSLGHLNRHQQTKKHKKYLEELNIKN